MWEVEEVPYCIPCQEPYAVKHILTTCPDLKRIFQNYYQETDIKEVFT